MKCEANFFQTKLLCVTNVTGPAITCVLCRDLQLTVMFSGLYNKIRLKERFGEKVRKGISNKIIVTLVTQGLLSSFLSRPVE